MKMNGSKSTHITFTLSPKNIFFVFLNKKIICMNTSVKYLGFHLDKMLTWAAHIKTKRKSLNLRLHKLNKSFYKKNLIYNKLLIYK